jgi:hypothetical protein
VKEIFLFVAVISFNFLSAQKIKTKKTCLIPNELKESSGIIFGANNSIWTHNDSGGKSMLYQLNFKGEIIRRLFVSNAKNADWEELTEDRKGNVYIGNFGNNANLRKDLCIYKIPHPDSLKKDTVDAVKINFRYEDQKSFPPTLKNRNFDMEAMIFYNDSLWFFSKNRTKPYNAYCKIYVLPAQKGNYTALLKDSIYLRGRKAIFSWITAAAINNTNDSILLLSHKKAWLITDFKNKRWCNAKIIKTRTTGLFSQKEAVVLKNFNDIYITNEKLYFLRAKLLKAYIKK